MDCQLIRGQFRAEPTANMAKIILIIEKDSDNNLWGRVSFEENLIVDSAPSLELLEIKIAKILHNLHGVNPTSIEFEISHDATVFRTF